MKRIYKYKINKEQLLKDFLFEKGYSKHLISFLKLSKNGICVNNIKVNVDYKLKKDDCLKICIEEYNEEYIKPASGQLNIVYEDDDLLIVNKQSNTLIHPNRFNQTVSLTNLLLNYNNEIVPHYITRLDKDTSGLVLIAKNRYVTELLFNQKINKEYYGIVQGKLNDCLIDQSIIKSNNKMMFQKDGLISKTEAKQICYSEKTDMTLVSFKLLTGRTHQIRAHCEIVGHPLIGDGLYGQASKIINRQALHCYHLNFIQPITNKIIDIFIELPDDMKKLLEAF